MQLISGIESELAGRSIALVLQVVADTEHEIEAYGRWSAQKRVDGVFLTDLRAADSRVPALEQLGLPALVIGGSGRHGHLPRIWSDDARAMSATVRYLAALGHRRIARVAGRPDFLHTQIRTDAFHAACAALGITEHTVVTDFSGPAGAGATRDLLSSDPAPPRWSTTTTSWRSRASGSPTSWDSTFPGTSRSSPGTTPSCASSFIRR